MSSEQRDPVQLNLATQQRSRLNTNAVMLRNHALRKSTGQDERRGMPVQSEIGTGTAPAAVPRRAGGRWYVALTRPKSETFAAEHLARQDFEYFLPRMAVTRRRARRFVTSFDPVFPGYIFIRMDLSYDLWRKVNGTRGIRTLIMAGERPLAVSPGVVETLRASTGDGGALVFRKSLRPGAEVRLVSGPFAEALGVVERLGSRDRVSLLLSLVGGDVRIHTTSDKVAVL